MEKQSPSTRIRPEGQEVTIQARTGRAHQQEVRAWYTSRGWACDRDFLLHCVAVVMSGVEPGSAPGYLVSRDAWEGFRLDVTRLAVLVETSRLSLQDLVRTAQRGTSPENEREVRDAARHAGRLYSALLVLLEGR